MTYDLFAKPVVTQARDCGQCLWTQLKQGQEKQTLLMLSKYHRLTKE